MATLMPFAVQQFFDDNGDPLAGGKIYFYAAGTSTLLDTYKDYNASTKHNNPVVLDSDGRPPSSSAIWLSAAAYKIHVDDSSDATIWEVDHVNESATGGATGGVYATYAALRAVPVASCAGIAGVTVLGGAAAGDGGHGQFVFVTTAPLKSATDDACTIIKPTDDGSSTGRWVRQLTKKEINPRWAVVAGVVAKGDGAADDAACIAAADTVATYWGAINVLDAGEYYMADAPTLTNPIRMMPKAKFKFAAGDTMSLTPIVEDDDDSQHFNCANGGVTVTLATTDRIRPQWFYSGSGTWEGAIQQAILAGTDVWLSRGQYTLTDSVWIDTSEQRIIGEGTLAGLTEVVVPNTKPGFMLGYKSTTVVSDNTKQGIRIEGIRFGASSIVGGAAGVKMGNANYCHVEKCHMTSMQYAIVGSATQDNRGMQVRDVWADQCQYGIYDVRDVGYQNQDFIGLCEMEMDRFSAYKTVKEGAVLSGRGVKIHNSIFRECGGNGGSNIAQLGLYACGAYYIENTMFNQAASVSTYGAQVEMYDATILTGYVPTLALCANMLRSTVSSWYFLKNAGSCVWNIDAHLQSLAGLDGSKITGLAGLMTETTASSSVRLEGYIPSGLIGRTGLGAGAVYSEWNTRVGGIDCVSITVDTLSSTRIDSITITTDTLSSDYTNAGELHAGATTLTSLTVTGAAALQSGATITGAAAADALKLLGSGAAATCGYAVSLNGTTGVTVSTTAVAANSTILLTRITTTGAANNIYVDSISAGNSFVVKSTASDIGSFNWLIVNPR